MFEVEVGKTGSDFVELTLAMRNLSVSNEWKLEVVLYLHEGTKGEREYSRDQFQPPLEKSLRLQPLPAESMFKVVAHLRCKESSFKSTIYTFTKAHDGELGDSTGSEVQVSGRESRSIAMPADRYDAPPIRGKNSSAVKRQETYPLCTSQAMLLSLGGIKRMQGRSGLQKTILAARKSRGISEFLNPDKGLRPEKRDERFKRALLVSSGMEFFNDLYQYREGKHLFRNDWFQGPFYSYDANEKQLRK